MAKTFQCSIVTPTETVLDDEVTYASFPAWDGQHGVMAGESPLLTQLGLGTLRLDFPEGGQRWFLLRGGFAQVHPDGVTLLTDEAIPAESLTVQQSERELSEAIETVKSASTNSDEAHEAQQLAYAKVALAREASKHI